MMCYILCFFFFNDTATTEIYTYLHTLSLHDALPICPPRIEDLPGDPANAVSRVPSRVQNPASAAYIEPHVGQRSEEHTSELQSLMRISYAVFCLKKKKQKQCALITTTYIKYT